MQPIVYCPEKFGILLITSDEVIVLFRWSKRPPLLFTDNFALLNTFLAISFMFKN